MAVIDIWYISLTESAIKLPTSCLSSDEVKRADRFRDEKNRSRWLYSRLALRAVMALGSHREPGHIRFEHGTFGKPRLVKRDVDEQPLHFSVSRSGDLCLIATCQNGPVGIDIEAISSDGGEDLIARQFFTQREAAAIDAQSGAQKNRSFLEIWTRKEAYTKALGVGLQHPLRDLDVSTADASVPVISAFRSDDGSAWRLVPLALPPGYVGTLAFQDTDEGAHRAIQIRTFVFDPRIIEQCGPPKEAPAADNSIARTNSVPMTSERGSRLLSVPFS